jgi:hypothetical protein
MEYNWGRHNNTLKERLKKNHAFLEALKLHGVQLKYVLFISLWAFKRNVVPKSWLHCSVSFY